MAQAAAAAGAATTGPAESSGSGSSGGWRALPRRRLGNYGGVPHPGGLLEEALPPWLARLVAKLVARGVFPADAPPNQVLANAYVGPTSGIGLHNDGPLFSPRVAIVSLGTPALLRFVPVAAGAASREHTLLLRPRSLLLFTGAAYTDFRHGIAPGATCVDAETCRNLSQCPGVAPGDSISAPGETFCVMTDSSITTANPPARVSLTVRRVPQVLRPAGEWSLEDTAEHARRLAWWRHAVSERE